MQSSHPHRTAQHTQLTQPLPQGEPMESMPLPQKRHRMDHDEGNNEPTVRPQSTHVEMTPPRPRLLFPMHFPRYNITHHKNKRFQTKFALAGSACSVAMLGLLALVFSEWRLEDVYSAGINENFDGYHQDSNKGRRPRSLVRHSLEDDLDQIEFENHEKFLFEERNMRHLEEEADEADEAEENNDNNNNAQNANDQSTTKDYSSYRCEDIWTETPTPTSQNTNNYSTPSQRCLYAQSCESDGVLFPFIFCKTTPQFTAPISMTTATFYLILLSPLLMLFLTLLFRLLGSTAEEYFSPSLEMFSLKLGLPPRFAGVTLLALGNGAADVSATINAIASDPENGYKMSLGALTGAAMFITTCIVGGVVVVNGGVVCRGALVRDVCALAITVVVVAVELGKGEVGARTERTFISIYVTFVLIVLIADVYHRAVMLPRIQKQIELQEQQRQLDAERWASQHAGDALNAIAGVGSAGSVDGQSMGHSSVGFQSLGGHTVGSQSIGGPAGLASQGGRGSQLGAAPVGAQPLGEPGDAEASLGIGGPGADPSPLEDPRSDFQRSRSAPASQLRVDAQPSSPAGNRALNAVLLALSNYNDNENMEDLNSTDNNRPNGWGIESVIEGNKSWDRPVVLHGADGILSRHHHHHHGGSIGSASGEVGGNENMDNFHSPYRVMEDMDVADGMCVQDGSMGIPAVNWSGAFHDGKQELMVHFWECWRDILDDDESGSLEKFLLICEFPLTVCRKLSVAIPCEGSYCRALVALSLALSPIWMGVYFIVQHDVNIWGWQMIFLLFIFSFFGLLVLRHAPAGDGTMASFFSVPIALYGFMIAASWIDFIADKLVDLLNFLGIVLRIPNSIMGLTILAWGNSMADLSANLTMARKGLANMAITACFAGPVFNILVGLGVGFGVLRGVTGTEVNYVTLTPSITTGFVFCFVNCTLLLVSGLAINKGVIPAGYGYVALGLYALYIGTSFLLQFIG